MPVVHNIYFCIKCGQIALTNYGKCPMCDGELELIPNMDLLEFLAKKTTQKEDDAFVLTLRPIEQFDSMAWMHRVHVMQGWELHGKAWPKGYYPKYQEGVVNVECPFCHQYWTTKIGTGSRMLSAGLFGLGSKKIGKQWHCHFCNSDF